MTYQISFLWDLESQGLRGSGEKGEGRGKKGIWVMGNKDGHEGELERGSKDKL